MQSNISDAEAKRIGHFSLRFKEKIIVGDTAYVFHASDAKLWHVDLVILLKWELHAEELLIIVDTDLGNSHLFLGIKVSSLALTSIDLEGRTLGRWLFIFKELKVASENTINVGRYGWRLLKSMKIHFILRQLFWDTKCLKIRNLCCFLI